MRTILIIPAYNEEANIVNTCNKIIEYNRKNGTAYDFIVINDGSRDSTGELCRRNRFPVVNLVHNLGIGGAVQTGYKYAWENGYDIAVQYDGDGQHDVACVGDIIAPILEGQADFVIGSRFVKKEQDNFKSTFMRRVGIRIISLAIRLVTGKKIQDTTSGFRACGREIMKKFAQSYPAEYPEPVTTVELLKQKYRVQEEYVKMNEREGGVSSIRAWKTVYYMINVILSIFVVGTRRYQ